jgi:lipopolysaccharide biosynthesis glycosyltransferase
MFNGEQKQEQEQEQKKKTPYAYVWLLMKGDSYLPGLYVSIYSVLRTNPTADLVVMVTNDVSEQARNTLKQLTLNIVEVPYITINSKPLKTKRQQEIYKNWISDSYTKWNLLTLHYEKVLFLDGDTIILRNLDHLFNLNTPAAPFGNPFVKPIGYLDTHLTSKKAADGYLPHAATITPSEVMNCLTKNGMLFTASTILLSPNITDYNNYIKMVKSMEPFGFSKCNSMVDEQSLAYYYSIIKKTNWTNIHHRYNYINWKKGFLQLDDVPYVMHYFSDKKPWNMKYNEWLDVICWWKLASDALSKTSIKPADIKLDPEQIELTDAHTDTFTRTLFKQPNTYSCLDIINLKI